MSEVMTVRGPVSGAELGFTLTHEHFLINTAYKTGNRDSYLYDIDLALQEAMRYVDAGGKSVIDLTNNGLHRQPQKIRWIAEQSGLHIVMGCGWYRELFYDHALWSRTTADIAAELIHEIEDGYGDTGIQPGVIGEIGCDSAYVSPAEERVFRAVGRAQRRTGLAVITHALDSPVGLAQMDVLEEEGADLRRVAIGHCATHPDPDYHEAIARRGAYVQFDVAGRYAHETSYQMRQIKELVRRGYLGHILISHDICFRTHLVAYGGKGYAFLITGGVEALKEAGFSQEQIDTVFVENPQRLLTGT